MLLSFPVLVAEILVEKVSKIESLKRIAKEEMNATKVVKEENERLKTSQKTFRQPPSKMFDEVTLVQVHS